jgi:hypothetical protein
VDSSGSESYGKLVEIARSDDDNSWVSTPISADMFLKNVGTFNHYMTQDLNRRPSLVQRPP